MLLATASNGGFLSGFAAPGETPGAQTSHARTRVSDFGLPDPVLG
jgi:hypothetical protein